MLHLDYEQGARLTRERYQKIARAHGVGPDDLGDRLAVVSLPPVYLDSPGAEDLLSREADGHKLVIVDSLRAAAPSVDENSSDIRRVLDTMTRASERTGAAFVVVHHATKPSETKRAVRYSLRGSGALYDAAGSVVVLDGEKGEAPMVHHEKARISGKLAG